MATNILKFIGAVTVITLCIAAIEAPTNTLWADLLLNTAGGVTLLLLAKLM
jgi:hypothetical protein